jgi:predicted dehydrogenase
MSIRVGIVGTGFGAQVHAPAYQAHEAFELVAIASPNRAQAVAKERGIPQAFPSLAAMLDGVELDAVSIASPPFMHRDDAVLAFSHGKHVLCEKPLARTVEEAEEIVAAARRAGTACGVAFEFRFDASRQALKELVVNQHLGPLREIEFTHLTTMLRRTSERKRGWWFEKARGGGIIQAFGSHMIDAVTWLAGRPPLSYSGFSRTANPQRHDSEGSFRSDVADGMFALLDYGDGLVGRLALDATNVVNKIVRLPHRVKGLCGLSSSPSTPRRRRSSSSLHRATIISSRFLRPCRISRSCSISSGRRSTAKPLPCPRSKRRCSFNAS